MEENKEKVEVVDENKKEVVDEKAKDVETDKGVEKKADSDNTNVPKEDGESKKEEATGQGVVETTDGVSNGITIDDLVTKDDLKASLDALNAKFDALMKELSDKDAKLKEAEEKSHDLEDKFVNNGDFGTTVSKGNDIAKDAGYETFESYSAKFKN